MKVFNAIYGMGGIATGGYYESLVAADKKDNVAGLLCEEHDEEVLMSSVEETDQAATDDCERVLSTNRI